MTFGEEFVLLFGKDVACKFFARFSGQNVTIPNLDGPVTGRLVSEVVRMYNSGSCPEFIAIQLRLQISTVQDILQEMTSVGV